MLRTINPVSLCEELMSQPTLKSDTSFTSSRAGAGNAEWKYPSQSEDFYHVVRTMMKMEELKYAQGREKYISSYPCEG